MSTDEYIVAVGSVCLLNCLMLGMSFCRVFDKQMTAFHFSVAFLKQLAGGSPHIVTVDVGLSTPPPSNSQDR